MIYLAWLIVFFTGLRFLVLLSNLVFRPWLKASEKLVVDSVSVLIPARNEEQNIEQVLGDVLNAQPRELVREILVYDDQSTDQTAIKVEALARRDSRIRLIRGDGLPAGWKGKNHACHQLGLSASGEWFLFIDADVRMERNAISLAVEEAKRRRVVLLSVFPYQVMRSWGEWLVVPVMNWILLTLLPLILVRTCRWTSFSGANGQFMLFRGSVYRRYRWHEQVRNDAVEDIRISRLIKKNRLKTMTLIGRGGISCRMYPDYPEAIKGFTKNFGQFFGNSIGWMLIFALLSSTGIILVPLILGWKAALLYLALLLLMRLIYTVITHQPLWRTLTLAIPHQFTIIKLITLSLRYKSGQPTLWKNREV